MPIQTKQNNVLRIIRKKSYWDTDISELHLLGKLEILEERSNSLKQKYLDSADLNKNPLTMVLRDELEHFRVYSRNINIKTLLP